MGSAENQVVKDILNYARQKCYMEFNNIETLVLFRTNNTPIKGRKSPLPAGFPDITGYILLKDERYAVPVFIECKTQEGKLSKEQDKFLNEQKKNGCLAMCCRDVIELRAALISFPGATDHDN